MLIKLLLNLSPEKRYEFRKYLRSEACSNSPKFASILEEMEKSVFADDVDPPSPAQFFARIFPGREFSPRILNTRLSQINTELFTFLAIEELKLDDSSLALFQLKAMNRLKLDFRFPATFKKAEEGWKHIHRKSVPYYRTRIELDQEQMDFQIRNPQKLGKMPFQETLSALDTYCWMEKLKYACRANTHDRITGDRHQLVLIEEVLDQVEATLTEQPILLQMYCLLYRILTHENQDFFFGKLFSLVLGQTHILDPDEGLFIFKQLFNYCTRKINEGKADFIPIQAQLFELAIQYEMILEFGTLSPQLYKNIIATFCRLGQEKKAEMYLNAFADQVTGDPSQSAFLYNKGVILFCRGAFRTALSTFSTFFVQHTSFKGFYFHLDARCYVCRCLLELGELDALEKELNALRMYVIRQKGYSEANRKNYFDFCTYMRKLYLGLASTGEEKGIRLKKLKNEIEQEGSGNIAYLDWIQYKIHVGIKK